MVLVKNAIGSLNQLKLKSHYVADLILSLVMNGLVQSKVMDAQHASLMLMKQQLKSVILEHVGV